MRNIPILLEGDHGDNGIIVSDQYTRTGVLKSNDSKFTFDLALTMEAGLVK